MKHILVVVEKPELRNFSKYSLWVDYKRDIEDLTIHNKDFELLTENILLIPLHNGLGALAEVFQTIARVVYKYKVFDGENLWHKGPVDADIHNP